MHPLDGASILSLVVKVSEFDLLIAEPVPTRPIGFSLLTSLPIVSEVSRVHPPCYTKVLLLCVSTSFAVSRLGTTGGPGG